MSNEMIYTESKGDKVARKIVKWLGANLDKWEAHCLSLCGDRDLCFSRGDTTVMVTNGDTIVKTDDGFKVMHRHGRESICDRTPKPKRVVTETIVHV